MPYETILFEKDNGVVTITLNRPERRNAWSYQMRDDVTQALKEITADREVRVLIITGAGESFCSGADVSDLIAVGVEQNDIDMLPLENNVVWIVAQLRNMKIPVIAAVNGHAIGMGLCIALAADIRIASDNASFSLTFIKRGIVPDTGATYFLPRVLGTARACELAFAGDTITASEADRIGMVNRVVEHGQLLPAARELAGRIAMNPPITVKLTKDAIYRSMESDLISHLRHELMANKIALATEDFKEGMAAYMEKREPIFRGR